MLRPFLIDYSEAINILEALNSEPENNMDLGSGTLVTGNHPSLGDIALCLNAAGESFYVTK